MLEFAAKTDVGSRGGENEDSIGWDLERNIFLVADGMGGHVNGKMASTIAKTTVLEADSSLSTEIQLVNAHNAICAAADEDSSFFGMGSTIVVAKIGQRDVEIAWVGDSRAYLWRQNQLTQVTRDHSFVELLRAENMLSEEQIRADPRANLVTQTLGLGDPNPSIEVVRLHSYDWLLLCSDGLNGELEDAEISEILAKSDDIEAAADELVAAAIERGGRDNTSVIIVRTGRQSMLASLMSYVDSKWFPLVAGSLLAIVVAFAFWISK